jgi:ABC-2 type transport system permease protein
MRGCWKLILVESKLFLREPPAFVFTLVFPSLLLVFFGSIFGNEADPDYGGGFGYVDTAVPGFVALMIGTIAFMGIPITTSSRREHKVLRRFRATPLHPIAYLAAQIAVYWMMALLGLVLLLVLGKALFGLRVVGSWGSLLLGFTLSALSFFAAGYVVASLSATGRMAQAVGQILFFPMMFLSGASIPLQMMPGTMRDLAEFLPLTHVVKLLQSLSLGQGWAVLPVTVLTAMLVMGTLVSSKVFRWE